MKHVRWRSMARMFARAVPGEGVLGVHEGRVRQSDIGSSPWLLNALALCVAITGVPPRMVAPCSEYFKKGKMVGDKGFEPLTSSM